MIASEAGAKLPTFQSSAGRSGLESLGPPSRTAGAAKVAALKWAGRCDPFIDLSYRGAGSIFTTKAECDSLIVPADPDRPSGPTLKLSLIRHRAIDPPNRVGVLLRPQLFDGDNFSAGVGFLRTTFVVSKPPYREGALWKMVVDGVELTRAEGGGPSRNA